MEEKLVQIIARLERIMQKAQETKNDMVFQIAFSYSFIDPNKTPNSQLKTLEAPLAGAEAILQLLERYPDICYFYKPDYLCLYFEHYYGKGYEELLLESVRRCPIAYTLHLLHRIINDKNNPHGPKALELMQHIFENNNYPEAIRQDAAERVTHSVYWNLSSR